LPREERLSDDHNVANMISRRGFLGLCAAAAPALWIARAGIVEMPKNMLLDLVGHCSFCGKHAREVRHLAGVSGRGVRICDECIGLCLDIYADEAGLAPTHQPVPSFAVDDAGESEFDSIAATIARGNPSMSQEAIADFVRAMLQPPNKPLPPRPQEIVCSFCDAHQKTVAKMVAGPTVYICDNCVGDAYALMRRFA
jgi:hypothetical protein